MDRQWLINLAHSEYDGRNWQLADPSSPSYIAHTHIQDILQVLHLKTRDAIDVFNTHADKRKQLHLYHLTMRPGSKPCGFAVMIKNLQVKLEQQGSLIKTEALLMRGYETASIALRWYEPHFDTFGEVSWLMSGTTAISPAQITRLLLQDTLRLAYESGVVAYSPLTPAATK